MAVSYTELIAKVRDWSNRDEEVLSDSVIEDCLKFAADKAYKTLRVPPLENIASYDSASLLAATTSSNNNATSITEIQLPYDLIEFIEIREVDASGLTTRVFNEKLDIRTFNDATAEKYSGYNYWARKQNLILLSPGFGSSLNGNTADSIELYYYRRLPALNAQYNVSVLNYNVGFLTTTGAASGVGNSAQLYFNDETGNTAYADQATAQAADPAGTVTAVWYQGDTVPNWLRDQNQRVLLFGALAEAFAYLQEDDQAMKYAKLYSQEVAELNEEDQRRNASGGNLQVNFNGRGLI
jgi:hypothetical protein